MTSKIHRQNKKLKQIKEEKLTMIKLQINHKLLAYYANINLIIKGKESLRLMDIDLDLRKRQYAIDKKEFDYLNINPRLIQELNNFKKFDSKFIEIWTEKRSLFLEDMKIKLDQQIKSFIEIKRVKVEKNGKMVESNKEMDVKLLELFEELKITDCSIEDYKKELINFYKSQEELGKINPELRKSIENSRFWEV